MSTEENKGTGLMQVGDLHGLSEPAKALVEKISGAIGSIFEPYQIERIAKAEAKAAIIQTDAQIEITDRQRRAALRWVAEETKKQENIDQITQKSIPLLDAKAKPEGMDNDWVTNFFEKSRIISDDEMQGLWSKVLAGEANAPGRFSRKTINLLSDLGKKDALLFTQLCGFVWNVVAPVPLIFDVQNKIYNDRGINFESLSHLATLGLIQFNGISGFSRLEIPKNFPVIYYQQAFLLSLPHEQANQVDIGHVLMTQAGQELFSICKSQSVPGFFEFVYDEFSKRSYVPARNITLGSTQSTG